MIPYGLGPGHAAQTCTICDLNAVAKATARRRAAVRIAEAFAWARGARAQLAEVSR